MKYSDDVYSLGKDFEDKYQKSKEIVVDEDLRRKQQELLKIILEKAKSEYLNQVGNKTGKIKIRFESEYNDHPEDGFKEIEELSNKRSLEFFLSEYCMYLGKVEYRCNELYTAYYEIIWDYHNYYNQQRGVIRDFKSLIKKRKEQK